MPAASISSIPTPGWRSTGAGGAECHGGDRVLIPRGFLWGAATSAYQVEGAVNEDGRGPSIWDTFCRSPGAIRDGSTGDVACDQFHRFENDIALMSELGIGAYRFSVSWPRVQPQGRGPAEQRPGSTTTAGWSTRCSPTASRRCPRCSTGTFRRRWRTPAGGRPGDTADRFADYAALVGEALGDVVPMWLTMNEPMVAAWLGYANGVHAPGTPRRTCSTRGHPSPAPGAWPTRSRRSASVATGTDRARAEPLPVPAGERLARRMSGPPSWPTSSSTASTSIRSSAGAIRPGPLQGAELAVPP